MAKWSIFMLVCIPWLLFGQANKTGLSVAIGAHQSAPLAIDRFYETSPDISFQSGNSVSLEGRVRYRRSLGEKFALVAGLGVGGYAHSSIIYASKPFLGGDRERPVQDKNNTFTTVHTVGELMGEWSIPLSGHLSLGLALGFQAAYFPKYPYSFSYTIIDDRIGTYQLFGYFYELNPHSRFAIAPRFGFGPRYDIGNDFTVAASLVGLYSRHLPIEDAQFFWGSSDPSFRYEGEFSQPYRFLGIELEVVYWFTQ